MFINDLADGVENMLVIFADDSNLSRVIPANEEDRRKGFEYLQCDLHHMAAWARKWLVTFSAPKTKPIIFSKTREIRAARRFLRRNLQDRYLVSPDEDPSSLPDLWASNQEARPNLGPHALFEFCGIYLRESQTVTLLGVTLSEDLGWGPHLNKVRKKARRALHRLRSARWHLTKHAALTVYKTHVRPIMEYACPLWWAAPAAHLSPLDAVQRQAANLIGLDDEGRQKLQLLAHRRGVSGLCCFHRLVHGTAPEPLQDLLPARPPAGRPGLRGPGGRGNRHLPVFRTLRVNAPRYLQGSFIETAAVLWNALPPAIRQEPTMQEFKVLVNESPVIMQHLGAYLDVA